MEFAANGEIAERHRKQDGGASRGEREGCNGSAVFDCDPPENGDGENQGVLASESQKPEDDAGNSGADPLVRGRPPGRPGRRGRRPRTRGSAPQRTCQRSQQSYNKEC